MIKAVEKSENSSPSINKNSRSNLFWVAPFNMHLAQSLMALFLYPKQGGDRMADNFGLKIGVEGEK